MNPTVSNTLFHFTGIDHTRCKFKPKEEAFGTLKSIIESQHFRLSLNNRNWTIYDDNEPLRHMDFGVPMLCFSETPIDYIGRHMEVFGYFGLGMKIEWAIKNHAQNVIYCDTTVPNYYGRTLAGVLDFIHHNLVVDPNTQAKWYWFRSLVGVTENIIYRDEREWRFIGRTENVAGGGDDFTPQYIGFTSNDIYVVVCPAECLPELQQVLHQTGKYNNFEFKIITSEELLKTIYSENIG